MDKSQEDKRMWCLDKTLNKTHLTGNDFYCPNCRSYNEAVLGWKFADDIDAPMIPKTEEELQGSKRTRWA